MPEPGPPPGPLAASPARSALLLASRVWTTQRAQLSLQVGFLLATGLTGGVSMLLLVPIVNEVSASSGGSAGAPVLPGFGVPDVPLPILLVVVVLLVSGQALLVRRATINSVVIQQALVDDLRSEAFAAVLSARWSFILSSRRSDIMEIATTGANRAGAAFSALLQAAVSTTIGIATFAVSVVVAPGLSLIVLAMVGGLLALMLRAIRPAHTMGREYGRRNRILQSVMHDSLDSMRLVRAHDADLRWNEELRQAFASTRAVQRENARRTSTSAAISTIGLVVSASILVLVAVALQMPPTTIVVVLVLASRLAGSARAVGVSLQSAANTLPAVNDLSELIRSAHAAAERVGQSRELPAADALAPTVRLVDVNYTYPTRGTGVQGLSFDVPRGQVTALVGPSGSGKSTTADLIMGLLSPDSGCVEVDGTALSSELLSSWRRRLAYVPQESGLLPGTVRRNLVWSTQDGVASDEACWAALDAASADFVRSIPGGLDGDLGDRGAWLSGGQRQRLAIARALLRHPELLVLDEATSSLDLDTESAVMQVVRALAPPLTVVVIAHRQSTLDYADQVVELGDGQVLSVRPGVGQ